MIIEKKGKSIVLYSALPTKTSNFILPLLGKNKNSLKFDSYFVNAYLDHTHKFLCLMYRFTGTPSYKEFEKTIMVDPLCVSHLEHGPYHVVYIFRIPDKYIKDVEHFMEGKYSKFSKAAKERIQRFYGRENSKPLLDIINKVPHLKKSIEEYLEMVLPADSELNSKPDSDIEIYKSYK